MVSFPQTLKVFAHMLIGACSVTSRREPRCRESNPDCDGPVVLDCKSESETMLPGVEDLINRCWSSEARERPKMAEIVSMLEQLLDTIPHTSHATNSTKSCTSNVDDEQLTALRV